MSLRVSGNNAGLALGKMSSVTLFNTIASESLAAGAYIADLWSNIRDATYTLSDSAGDMFAISGSTLVRGATALNHETTPYPSITIVASNGSETATVTVMMEVRKALPAIPMANGAKVVSLGHSFVQRGAYSNGKGVSSGNLRAVEAWIRNQDHRFNMEMWYDDTLSWMTGTNKIAGSMSGVGGDHIVKEGSAPGTIERTPWIIARGANAVILNIGTNDISSGVGIKKWQQLAPRFEKQLKLFLNAGIPVIIVTVTDRTAWLPGSAQADMVAGINAWIKSQAGRDGVYICDWTADGFNYPDLNPLYFGSDGLHPNPVGGKKMAERLLPILQSLVTAGDTWGIDPTVGNIWPSNGLLGTTGTISASYGSGQVATGHRILRNTGSRTGIVASKEVISGTFEKQVITFPTVAGGTGTDAWRFVYGTTGTLLTTLGLVVGDWVEMLCYVELNAWDGWLSIGIRDEMYNASTLVSSSEGGFNNPDNAISGLSTGFSGWIRCMPTEITTGVDRIRLDSRPILWDIDNTKPGVGVIKISQPIMRKVPSPKTAWNL